VADYGICIAAPLYFRHASSLEHDTGPHPEGPGRIPAIERAMDERDWLGFELRDAPEATVEQITRVHPGEYVEHVRKACERGVALDPDTITSPGSWGAALHAAGGQVAMVDALLGGEARLAFCGLRPPGHHAETLTAMGFCLFSNIAIAARHALEVHGLERIFVLDWDVHHGNGTNEVFHGSRELLFASLHQWPLYPGTGALDDVGEGDGEGFSLNLPMPPGSGGDEWLSMVEHVVLPAAREFKPQLVLVSAGFDAHRADPLANCMLETRSFAELAAHVRQLAGELDVPVGAVLEGGYDLDALAASVVATLGSLSNGDRPARSVARDELSERAASTIGRYWPL
jgi:acetoin utilization deacetylase AcuC-like enzyme